MPIESPETTFSGIVGVRGARDLAHALLEDAGGVFVAFDLLDGNGHIFVPLRPVEVDRSNVQLSLAQVNAVREKVAALVTPAHLAAARAARAPRAAIPAKATRSLSEAIDAYMVERERSCKEDQARRIRGACELFVDLEGNLPLVQIDRDRLRRYRDQGLANVPAHENKVRLVHGTTTVAESMAAVKGTSWPSISSAEQAKRMNWLCGLFKWLREEKWIDDDPAVGLDNRMPRSGAPKKRDQDKRKPFDEKDLEQIFGSPWFVLGRGEKTTQGTYREWQSYYYWLPLCGLYSGARIRELCQLTLTDIKRTPEGVWFFDINEIFEPDEIAADESLTAQERAALKSLKNTQSIRCIPIHPHLIRLGLIDWCESLRAAGYDRLFPELKHDRIKGYGKAATKWFSAFLKRFGWPRDGTKVFHSFRHTLTNAVRRQNPALSEIVLAQITGHERHKTVLFKTYGKDLPPGEVLDMVVKDLTFALPDIAPFDREAGLDAVRDALRRKRTT